MTMQKSKIWIIAIIILVLAGAAFYWYELKPNQIRKQCSQKISIFDVSVFGKELFDDEEITLAEEFIKTG